MTTTGVRGDVISGFEPVRDAFAERLGEVGKGGAAFAAVIRGQLVVDLWAGRAGREEWSREKRVVWHAGTKGFSTIIVARLVEKGVIDVQAPVAKYWPEFAAAGKAGITVAQVLSHRSGVVTIPGYADFMKPTGEGWDNTDEILRRLASATPMWPPGTAHGYHGLTFVWLLGEIVRRATDMSLGALLREEIAGPLGLELDLGTPLERQGALAPPIATDDPLPGVIQEQLEDPMSPVSQAFLAVNGEDFHTTSVVLDSNPALLALELPYNATATARAAAILYGALADGGRCGDRQIVSPTTIKLFTREASRGKDRVVGMESRFGLGFMLALPPDGYHPWGPHSETFGHTGLGIQFSLADPISRLGVGFTRSHYSWKSLLGKELLDVLYECIANQ
jgi:CubicO group peptidase (beta-lactamase class C family)